MDPGLLLTPAGGESRLSPDIPVRLYPGYHPHVELSVSSSRMGLSLCNDFGARVHHPRPVDEKSIHNLYAHGAQGSISYSEGTNDDITKFQVELSGSKPSTPVMETLREYARYFIGPGYTETAWASAFERTFSGSLLINDQGEDNFAVRRIWKQMH